MRQFPVENRFDHRSVTVVGGTGKRNAEAPILFPILLAYCVILIAITAIYPAAALFTHVSNDFGEGWNAYWAQAVQRGTPLYSTSRILTANNYPPLSFYLNALLGGAIGDNIVAGRIIASASMIGVAGLIARIVALLGAPARWAWLSAAIFLLYNLIFLRQMVAVNNPQWLGEVISVASMLPLIARLPSTLRTRDIVAASATMVIAGLVKHNQFALPLATTAMLYLFDRRALAVWCLSGLVFAGVACALLYAAYGEAVFVELIEFQRTISLPTFRGGLIKLVDFVPLIAVSALSLRWQRANPRLMLLLLYALFGVVCGTLQRLGSGVFINAYDDALIGLSATAGALLGLAAADSHSVPLRRGRRAALLVVLLVPILISTPRHVRQSFADLRDLGHQQTIWQAMIADARAAPGPVLCEIPAVCYWAGKPLLIDFFAYGQRLRFGAAPAPLYNMIARHRARVMVIERDADLAPGERRLPPPFPALIDEKYRVTRLAGNHVAIMVPR